MEEVRVKERREIDPVVGNLYHYFEVKSSTHGVEMRIFHYLWVKGGTLASLI